jgi:hypothetical protein
MSLDPRQAAKAARPGALGALCIVQFASGAMMLMCDPCNLVCSFALAMIGAVFALGIRLRARTLPLPIS